LRAVTMKTMRRVVLLIRR